MLYWNEEMFTTLFVDNYMFDRYVLFILVIICVIPTNYFIVRNTRRDNKC